jgi:hypothetical protein
MQPAAARWIGLEFAGARFAVRMSRVDGVTVRSEFSQAISHDGWPVWVELPGSSQGVEPKSGWVVVLKNDPGKAGLGFWAERVTGPFSAPEPASHDASESITIDHADQPWLVLCENPRGGHGVL